jgi:hypothetical protein
VPDGPFRIDLLRLHSPAPLPVSPPAAAGRVLAAGAIHRASVDGVRVAVERPGWLVLGESFDPGWRASCDGRSLGAPVVVDAFANGWPVRPGCRRVSFTYAPQHTALLAEILSGLACLLALLLLLVRRAPAVERAPSGDLAPADAPRRIALPRALACGLAVALVLGFVLSVRAGLVVFAATTVVAWAGVGARRLVLAAAALLVVAVPASYLLTHADNHGGYDFNYAVEHIAGHWLAVAALVLLAAAAIRTVLVARRGSSES